MTNNGFVCQGNTLEGFVTVDFHDLIMGLSLHEHRIAEGLPSPLKSQCSVAQQLGESGFQESPPVLLWGNQPFRWYVPSVTHLKEVLVYLDLVLYHVVKFIRIFLDLLENLVVVELCLESFDMVKANIFVNPSFCLAIVGKLLFDVSKNIEHR